MDSHVRGSGASYAEGYVAGLPRAASDSILSKGVDSTQGALIQTRMLAIRDAAKEWLDHECDLRLVSGRRTGRQQFDSKAESRGKVHGAIHEVKVPDARKRITNH